MADLGNGIGGENALTRSLQQQLNFSFTADKAVDTHTAYG